MEVATQAELLRTVERIAAEARTASRLVARSDARRRRDAIERLAARLRASSPRILEANRADLAAGERSGLAPAMLDRLKLDEGRLDAMARALEEIAAAPEVLGGMEAQERRPNGLRVGRMRIPLGVILMIYEARPNVTTDAFALCLKAGNAVILRGGSEAAQTNGALAAEIAAALVEAGLPAAAAQLVPTTDRAAIEALLLQEQSIDLVIPRGGEGLIRFVAERSRIPVIKHYKGVCHVYVDEHADQAMALDICENAKVSRPGVCNAAETILVHAGIARDFVPKLAARLQGKGVELRGDEQVRALAPDVTAATEEDWGAEYLALIVAVRVVPSLDEAIAHIEKYGSQHTEAIVTRDDAAGRRFIESLDSSTVIVNASTRFADGGELGLGAEIGISTSKLHAFGPMGARELTTTKFVVFGDGQVRK